MPSSENLPLKILPAKPLGKAMLRELKTAIALVTDGEQRGDPRRFPVYRVLAEMRDGPTKTRLVADIARQEELTTSCMTSIMLNGLYPTQFDYPALFENND